MSTDPSPDPVSFEEFLASVFAVQSSGLDRQSLSALVELRRSVNAAEPDLAQAMQMAADRARSVADATGVAVAQLIANQLVYRAGSGSGVASIGRHVTAVLTASASNEARGEILRVENARDDSSIEAEVCRLYGANALLIVPIYRQHAVAGVIEVFFSEPHTFQDQEVLTYRIMARLLEQALSADARREQEEKAAAQLKPLLRVMEPNVFPIDDLDGGTATPSMKFIFPNNLRWNVATAGLAAVLLIVAGLAYHHRSAAHTNTASAKSTAAQEQAAAKPSQASSTFSSPDIPAAATNSKAPSARFRRVRVGLNEIDYIAEDVTIRHFASDAAGPQMLAGERRVNFGEDVTVHYFGDKPQVTPQIHPVPAAERSVER